MPKHLHANRQSLTLDSGVYAGDSDLSLLRKAREARLPQYIHREGREGRKEKTLTADKRRGSKGNAHLNRPESREREGWVGHLPIANGQLLTLQSDTRIPRSPDW